MIAGVKRVDWRRMDDLKEELSLEKCLMGRLEVEGSGQGIWREWMKTTYHGWYMCMRREEKEKEDRNVVLERT